MESLSVAKNKYEGWRNSKVTKPELIGYFSLDTDRNYLDDYSQLKYIRRENIEPRLVNMNLNDKNEDRTPKTFLDTESNTNNILKFFTSHREALDVFSTKPTRMDDVPFVTHRGALIRIANLPYTHLNSLSTNVCLANGVIYFETFYVLNFVPNGNGHKFEQYIHSDSPYSQPNTEIPNNENDEFNCIFTSSIGNHKLYYKAEMDGFIADENNSETEDFINNSLNYNDSVEFIKNMKSVELKTLARDMPDYKFRKYHSLKWWTQSYFGNVDVIACGYKNSDNHVTEIKQFKAENLCEEAKEWNPNTCFNFLDSYLNFMKEALTKELVNRGYDVGGNVNVKSYPVINLTLIKQHGQKSVHTSGHGQEHTNLLSDWFLEMMKEKSNNN